MKTVEISGVSYELVRVRGRLFLDGVEQGCVLHDERLTIEYSDLLTCEEVAFAVGVMVGRSIEPRSTAGVGVEW